MSHRSALRPSVACLLLCAAPGAALAESPTFEIMPHVGYRLGGGFERPATLTEPARDIDLDESSSWGLGLGLYRDPNSFYELLYSTQETSFNTNDPNLSRIDVSVDYLHFGGTLLFADENWLVPYLSLTAGATRFDADGYDSETKFSASLGGGMRLPFTDNFSATLGLRGYLTFIDSNTSVFCVSGNEESGCLLRSSGSTLFQTEAQLGFALRF
jgi:opacity protein-like surface antigen